MKLRVLFSALLFAAVGASAQEALGTIKATTRLWADGSKATTIVDPEKRTAEETVVNAGGKITRKTTYLLGERDLAVGAIFADGKGVVIYNVSYQRDAYGHIVQSTFTSPDGRYLGKRIFNFGAGDKVTSVQDYDANGQIISSPQAAGKPSTSRKRR